MHRFLRWNWAYKYVHSVHQRNVNVGPLVRHLGAPDRKHHIPEPATHLFISVVDPQHVIIHISWLSIGHVGPHCGSAALIIKGKELPTVRRISPRAQPQIFRRLLWQLRSSAREPAPLYLKRYPGGCRTYENAWTSSKHRGALNMARPQPTDGARMVYLIKRKNETTREELIAHWFANHMPGVIARNDRNRASGAAYAYHYVATLFDPVPEQNLKWDGIAQLWYSAPLPRPSQASAVEPYDTFQEKVEPYWPWATREYVIIDGGLTLAPLTLNTPFPCTRSGFFKVTFFVALKADADRDAFFAHWLDIHIPNVRATMRPSAVSVMRLATAWSRKPNRSRVWPNYIFRILAVGRPTGIYSNLMASNAGSTMTRHFGSTVEPRWLASSSNQRIQELPLAKAAGPGWLHRALQQI